VTVPAKVYRKMASERRRLYLDYSCWLKESETLTNFQVVVSPYTTDAPLVVDTSYPDLAHKQLMVFLEGGVPGTDYVLSMLVTTNETQRKQDDLGVMVQ
jgi:hypothetical protein